MREREKERERLYCNTLYFSLIIVKSLQLRERRQIVELRKYCLIRVIIFLWRMFSLFCFSQVWEFRVNSLHLSAALDSFDNLFLSLLYGMWSSDRFSSLLFAKEN